jgi:hypothetical protein
MSGLLATQGTVFTTGGAATTAPLVTNSKKANAAPETGRTACLVIGFMLPSIV